MKTLKEILLEETKLPKVAHLLVIEDGNADFPIDVKFPLNKRKVRSAIVKSLKSTDPSDYYVAYDEYGSDKDYEEIVEEISGVIKTFVVEINYMLHTEEELEAISKKYGDWEDITFLIDDITGKEVWGMAKIKKFARKVANKV